MSAAPTPSTGNIAGDSSQDIEQVSKDGDVILVVGPDQRKMQAASHFLGHISPVFRAMLDSSMKEGLALRDAVEGSPVEISFPEDDSRTMLQILRCLYGAGTCSKPSAAEARDVAILADKYDMTERLKYFGAYWLRVPVDTGCVASIEEAWDILVAAYLLKSDVAFFDTSKAIIRHSDKSLLKYANSTHDKELGLQLGSEFMINSL
ncbi:hypothetical protein ACHAQD_007211 [Fusarium lateritium]